MKASLLHGMITPTTDIYFFHHLKKYVDTGSLFAPSGKRPIGMLSEHIFRCGRNFLISRYARRRDLDRIAAQNPARVYYLIDDNIREVAQSTSLPDDYRRRLNDFASDVLPDIEALADVVVTPSEHIAQHYADRACEHLDPAFVHLCQDLSHWQHPNTIRLVFMGTRSHLQDLVFVAPVLKTLADSRSNLEVTTFLGDYVPDELKAANNVRNLKPLGWRKFKQRVLTKERFHFGIAPMLDTPFNKGRSINKILDHGAVGAIGLYSPRPPFSDHIKPGENGCLIEDNVEQWRRTVEQLIDDQEQSRALAQDAVRLCQDLGNPARVRHYWAERLGFELD